MSSSGPAAGKFTSTTETAFGFCFTVFLPVAAEVEDDDELLDEDDDESIGMGTRSCADPSCTAAVWGGAVAEEVDGGDGSVGAISAKGASGAGSRGASGAGTWFSGAAATSHPPAEGQEVEADQGVDAQPPPPPVQAEEETHPVPPERVLLCQPDRLPRTAPAEPVKKDKRKRKTMPIMVNRSKIRERRKKVKKMLNNLGQNSYG